MEDESRKTQLVENMRFFGNLRFQQLTLLTAVLTLVGAGIAQFSEKQIQITDAISLRTALGMFALAVTGVIWIMEVRATTHWVAHRELVPDWWPRHRSRGFGWISSTNALLLLLAAIYGFWLYCVWQWKVQQWIVVGFTVGWVILIVFSVVEYWGLWFHGTTGNDDRHAAVKQ